MSASAPTNAVLANTVVEKDLKDQKKHLDHVKIDEKTNVVMAGVPSASIHMGPGDKADFAPNSIHATSSTSAIGVRSSGGNHLVESAHSGEVSVQSQVTIDTTQEVNQKAGAQIQALLSRLSTTTAQVDEYSRRANEKISADANKQIQKIIADTQQAQDSLLRDASSRALEIEGEYSSKLKAFLQELDASKASNLASLEKDLNFRQETLLSEARDNMDQIHQEATQKKVDVMQQANRNMIRDVDKLTDRVKTIGEAEVERRMNSTTTTVITTKTATESAQRDILLEKSSASGVTLEKTSTHTVVSTEPRANVTRL